MSELAYFIDGICPEFIENLKKGVSHVNQSCRQLVEVLTAHGIEHQHGTMRYFSLQELK
jgi:hypothetical protein